MAPVILPGYDFGETERPTRANLLRAATGLQVLGLQVAQLEGIVIGQVTGTTSGASGALINNSTPTGMIWSDPQGNIWVMERAGPVKLFRYEGGWESRRLHIIRDSANTGWIAPGVTPWVNNSTSPNIMEDFLRQEAPANSRASGTQIGIIDEFASGEVFLGLNADTVSSGYIRWVGRGLTWLEDLDAGAAGAINTLTDMQNTFRLWRPNENGNVTFHKESAQHTLAVDRYYGWICGPSPNASKVSDASGNHSWRVNWAAWLFGPLGIPRRT